MPRALSAATVSKVRNLYDHDGHLQQSTFSDAMLLAKQFIVTNAQTYKYPIAKRIATDESSLLSMTSRAISKTAETVSATVLCSGVSLSRAQPSTDTQAQLGPSTDPHHELTPHLSATVGEEATPAAGGKQVPQMRLEVKLAGRNQRPRLLLIPADASLETLNWLASSALDASLEEESIILLGHDHADVKLDELPEVRAVEQLSSGDKLVLTPASARTLRADKRLHIKLAGPGQRPKVIVCPGDASFEMLKALAASRLHVSPEGSAILLGHDRTDAELGELPEVEFVEDLTSGDLCTLAIAPMVLRPAHAAGPWPSPATDAPSQSSPLCSLGRFEPSASQVAKHVSTQATKVALDAEPALEVTFKRSPSSQIAGRIADITRLTSFKGRERARDISNV